MNWTKVARDEFQELEQHSLKLRDISTDSLRRKIFPSATQSSSVLKNRYPDILPFEDTRVHLQPNPNDGSDYINANFILNHKYISCQAPTFPTFADFWKMIWEQKSIVIVMLTKLFESGKTKANIYWPVYIDSTVNFGEVSVTLVEETTLEHFVLRHIILKKGEELRQVFHLHYTDWPDHGVPKSPRGILCLCRQANILLDDSIETSPIVVHCSAGIGRSGSFIAIHQTINQIDRNSSFDILATAKRMRRDRIGMIQSEEQYRFVHQTVKEYSKQNLFENSDEERTSPVINKSWRSFSSDIPALVPAV